MVAIILQRGVFLPELDLWLDARERRESALISHAHADHVGRHVTPFFTRATAHLLRGIFKGRGQVLEYGEEVDTPRYRLSLHPSAHCLGAAQVLVQVKATGERILYTGDLKLRPNATAPATEVVRCDTLVIDSTYGAPQYRFPPDEQTLTRLHTLVDIWRGQGFTPVVMGYSTGKAQEALWHLTSWGYDVAVHPSAYEVVRSYEEMGVVFPGPFRRLDPDTDETPLRDAVPYTARIPEWIQRGLATSTANTPSASTAGHVETEPRPAVPWPTHGQHGRHGLRDGEVIVAPPGRHGLRDLPRGYQYRTVFLTGWAVGGGNGWVRSHSSLPLSDHCDFDDLLTYVRLTGARRVLPVFGGRDLATHLRRAGLDARHLDPHNEGRQMAQQLALL